MPDSPYSGSEMPWALIGAGLGGASGYGLSKLISPDDRVGALLAALAGAGAGGGLGYAGGEKWDRASKAMADDAARIYGEETEKAEAELSNPLADRIKRDSQQAEAGKGKQ